MPVKIRLQRHGTKKRPFYHIVAADSRSPRDGKFIEKLGSYNPLTVPASIELDIDKAYVWLTNGAQPTDTAHAILKYKGVLYKKHLQRGVKKGAFAQEKADEMLATWLKSKDAQVDAHIATTVKKEEERRQRLFGTPTAKKIKAVESTEENA
jgi:small subunit ribosomal protein S16